MNTVKLVNKSGVSNTAMLTIGDQIIPFFEATISLKVGEEVSITAKVPASMIDVEALEKNTKLVLTGEKNLPPARETRKIK